MINLSTSEAIALVRKNLDEAEPNGSVMYGPSDDEYKDNNSLDDIIARNLPEAINAVHLGAPVQLLSGEEWNRQEDVSAVAIDADGVLTVSLSDSARFLRLVAFRAEDSGIVLTDVLPEASPEGRKQLNKYIRGRADRPRLVMSQGTETAPVLKYYTIADPSAYSEDPASAIHQLFFVREQLYSEEAESYKASRRLRQNVIDCLTAMVMETYLDQRAQSYYQKATNYPII